MAKYYPVLLGLEGKKCVVVGGGEVAERKIHSLLKAGASVYVISPLLKKSLIKYTRDKRISYIKSDYQKKILKNTFLVIAATDDKALNSEVSRDAGSLGILVNVVDSPILSNFIVPAVLRNRDLIISISTSGKAPILSKKIKEDLRKLIGSRYAKPLNLLEDVRRELKLRCPYPGVRGSILTGLVNSKVAPFNNKKALRAKIKKIIKRFSA